MLISTHKRLCKQVPPSVAVDSKLFKIKKKKIGARRIRTFDSGGIANYQKIIKKFKTMIKIIKIIKNF